MWLVHYCKDYVGNGCRIIMNTTHREFISECLSRANGTLWNPSNTVHPWCTFHMQAMPMNGHWIAQQQVMNVHNNLLVFVNYYSWTRDSFVHCDRHSIVTVDRYDFIDRYLKIPYVVIEYLKMYKKKMEKSTRNFHRVTEINATQCWFSLFNGFSRSESVIP